MKNMNENENEIQILDLTLFEGMINVQQRQVITVDVGESHLGIVSCTPSFIGPDEALRY